MTNESSIDRDWAARFEILIGQAPGDTDEDAGSQFSVLLGDVIELLMPAEMAQADKMTIEAGTTGMALMEKAGLAVAESVRSLLPGGGRVAVMTGPGNNGGDGYVTARLLAEAGYETVVWMAFSREKLTGDASFAAASWTGSAKGLSSAVTENADLIVDALFGAGLSKPVTGITAKAIDAVNRSPVPVVAVDLPSGIDGASGQVLGTAIQARETVTFFRMKPGHVLFPGRQNAGWVTVADIGIRPDSLATIKPATNRNHPDLWSLPEFEPTSHKYDRGHTLIVAGPATATGAARLAARGALRVGSGLVTVAAPQQSVLPVAAQLTSVMLREMDGPAGLSSILSDARVKSAVVGPGLGVGEQTVRLVDAALTSGARLVLDADALTSHGGTAEGLFEKIHGRAAPVTLTPHEGEFAKLFPGLVDVSSKLERARRAADLSGAIVVLKGADTVIAAPGGRAMINDNAPRYLATAGSGDVLAGFVAGLQAQGMDALGAAAAGVWLHGAAGQTLGRGLIAEDLPEALKAVFAAREARPD